MPCTLERSGLKQMKVIEQKIRSLYHSTVFLRLVSALFHIFSFFWVCLCRHFVCFSPVSRPRTQILSLFTLIFHSPWTNQSCDFCCVPGSSLLPPPYWKARRLWGRRCSVYKRTDNIPAYKSLACHADFIRASSRFLS